MAGTAGTALDAVDAVDGAAMRAWARVALHAMAAARAEIDALNVFPVADGDTGTNLYLTLEAAHGALEQLPPGSDLATTVRTLARGALVGARGNSGIILSQLFRGIAGTLAAEAGRETTSANADLLAEALRSATDSAYAAVVTPVEGTMLSVARGAADAAAAEPHRDVVPVVLAAAAGARDALARTPSQLDALARAGVVDAGGRGLVVLLDALAAVVTRTPLPAAAAEPVVAPVAEPAGGAYEVMYLLDAADGDVPALRAVLAGLGDSVVVVGGDGLWSVHLHTDDAGAAVEAGLATGRPHRLRIAALHDTAAAARAVLVVAEGPGLAALLEQAGAHPIDLPAGARLAADDLLALAAGAAELVLLCDAVQVVALEEAVRRVRRSGLRAAVVPLRSPVQAVAAVAVHDPSRGFDDDVVAMTAAAGHMRWGALTAGGRALVEGEPVPLRAGSAEVAALELAERMLSGGGELVTLLLGAGAGAALGEAVRAGLARAHPEVETVVHPGGQPGALLLVGVE
ncbi:hypothetical protein CLV35_0265 [Motilibacter peucedani]|uniref:DhaL domain-containing protein n=1 Tax=Motilibacter peucedani TaxID=598650 RepID=A0A420XUT1_9ACTN|nr:DAK2 domain-containing protein [Motilibacter peucedani]RKS80594.1 hypothetical protein CLV35_0265 [Motilibacter peucedani]